jgi:hypothetical protein
VSRRFRVRGETVVVTLVEEEVQLLAGLPDQLRGVLEDADDPAHRRIFPRAYVDPTEEDAERQWQEMVHPDLLQERFDALAMMTATLAGATPAKRGGREVTLDAEQTQAWLSALNDARLALGVRLDITEDERVVEPSDPRAPAFAAYAWLTWFQGELVEVLLG